MRILQNIRTFPGFQNIYKIFYFSYFAWQNTIEDYRSFIAKTHETPFNSI